MPCRQVPLGLMMLLKKSTKSIGGIGEAQAGKATFRGEAVTMVEITQAARLAGQIRFKISPEIPGRESSGGIVS